MTAGRTIPHREYFASHPVLRTSDLDEARHRIGQTFCDHRLDVHGRRADLAVRHNAVRGLDMSVNYLAYGPRVTVDPGLLGSFYLFHVPLAGQARIRHRGEEMTATPERAAILNPDRSARLDWGEGCRKLLIQINRDHLEKVARALVGAPLPGPIRFDLSVDLTSESGRRLQRIVTACAEAVEKGELFRQPLGGADLRAEHDLAHALLTLQPSNVSHIIERADHQARPKTIRLALDYIHANLGEPDHAGGHRGGGWHQCANAAEGLSEVVRIDADAGASQRPAGCRPLPAHRTQGPAERVRGGLVLRLFASGPVFPRLQGARFGHSPSEGRARD